MRRLLSLLLCLAAASLCGQTIVQRSSTSDSLNSGIKTGGKFWDKFPSPTQGGNTILVFFQVGSATSTYSTKMGDDVGNVYTPVATNIQAANHRSMIAYMATNAIAGARQIFPTNTSGNGMQGNRGIAIEISGIKAYQPVDVFSSANATATTSAAAGSMTPTVTGDFIVQAVMNANWGHGQTTSYTNANQANLPWKIVSVDTQDGAYCQAGIYSSTSAFNPTATIGSAQDEITIAIALKVDTSQGAVPPAGIYLNGMTAVSQPQIGNAFGAQGTPRTNSIQYVQQGNTLLLAFTSARDMFPTNIVTSTGENVTRATLGDNRNFPGNNENSTWWYITNSTPTNYAFLTIQYKSTLGSGNGADGTIKLYDIQGAAASLYVTRATNVGNQTVAGPITPTNSVTPTRSGQLAFTEFQQNTETVTNYNSPWLPDFFTYDGAADISGPQNMDQSGGFAHTVTTGTSTLSVTVKFDQATGAVNSWVSDTLVIDHAPISGLIMPTNRFMPWVDSVGVRGGIPVSSNMTVFATIAPTTDSASIVSAWNSCPSNQVLQLQAGTYNLTNKISAITSSGTVLRGAGMSNTVLRFPGTSGGIYIGTSHFFNGYSGGFPSPTVVDVTSGYTQGSSNLVVSSTAGMVVGNFMVMDQSNNLAHVNINGYEGNRPAGRFSGDRALQQFFRIESTNSATSVTVWPPVAVDYWGAAYGPQVWWMSPTSMQAKNGVEDMTIDIGTTSGAGTWQSVIGFESCRDYWVKNVMGMNASHSHIGTFGCFRGEIRHCYFFNTQNSAQTSYGITFSYTQSELAEDNTLQQIADPVMAQDDGSLNVFAYNFTTNNYYAASAGFLLPSFDTHATHSYGNLFEGNHGTGVSGDFIHGSGGNNVSFRNRLTGWSPWTFGGGESVNHLGVYQIDLTNRYFASVGNLLGTSGKTTNYESVVGNEKNNYIYSIGLNNGDGYGPPVSTWPDDQTTVDTFYRHMDYDVVTGGISYNPTNDYVTLPRSLYKSDTQIATLLQGLPAFNPTNHTAAQMDATNIPAGFRFAFGVDPGQDPIITVQPNNTTVTAPAVASFSVTATGTAPLTYQWYKGGVLIAGATASNYSTPPTAYPADNGSTFYVQVTSAVGGPLQSATATLTVNTDISISVQPQNQTVAIGANATWNITATGGSGLTYAWTFNGSSVGGNSSSYTRSNCQLTDSGGVVQCTITDTGNIVPSATATLTVITPTVTPSWTGGKMTSGTGTR